MRFTAQPRLTVAARQQPGAAPPPLPSPLPSPLPPAAFELEAAGEVDRLLYPHSALGELEHRAEAVVHSAQRLEHRLQRRAAALPVALRVAGGVAGACAKSVTAPLSTVQMAQMTSTGLNAVQVGVGVRRMSAADAAWAASLLVRATPDASLTAHTLRSWPLSGSEAGCRASSGVALHSSLGVGEVRPGLGCTSLQLACLACSGLTAVPASSRAALAPLFACRGNTVDVLRTVPSRSIELSAYDALKRTFR